MTIQAALDEFIIDRKVKGYSDYTIQSYSQKLPYFIDAYGPGRPISGVTLDSLKQYYLELSKRDITSITKQSYIRELRAFLNWCHEEGYIQDKLPDKFRLPKAKRKVIDILTDDEIQRLLIALSGDTRIKLRNRCICLLMLDSGLRLNEVISLTVDNVKLNDGYIIADGKGNKQRVVPLGRYTRSILTEYMNPRARPVTYSDSAFLTVEGRSITRTTIKQMFRKLKKQTGIPRLRAHLLRHTFATYYLENGGDIYTLQVILGHTTLEMVKQYVHVTHKKLVAGFPNYSPMDNLVKWKGPQYEQINNIEIDIDPDELPF